MKIVLSSMCFFVIIIATNAATIQRSNTFNLSSSKYFTNEVTRVTKPSTTTTTTKPALRATTKKRVFQTKRLKKSDCTTYCQKSKFTKTYIVPNCKATDRPVRCRKCRGSFYQCFRSGRLFK